MSKRRKQKQKKLPVPLIGLVIGGILLIAAAIFLFSGGSISGGKPALAVDQQVIDYGEVKFNTNKTFAIKVTKYRRRYFTFQRTAIHRSRGGVLTI